MDVCPASGILLAGLPPQGVILPTRSPSSKHRWVQEEALMGLNTPIVDNRLSNISLSAVNQGLVCSRATTCSS